MGLIFNLLGQREQSQYGSKDYNYLTEICFKKAKELNLNLDIKQSNVEGEIVNLIQNSVDNYEGIIINAAAYSHTSVAIRDALAIFKNLKLRYTYQTFTKERNLDISQ